MRKIFFGNIHADYLTLEDTLNEIEKLAVEKKGGFIVTPNVDHIVISEKNDDLKSAYADASLSLADGKPLLWMSQIAGFPLPEKISGSDLVRPLLIRAAEKGLTVYFLGAAPGVGLTAAEILTKEIPNLKIVGVDAPPMGFETDIITEKETLEKMLSANPDIVLFALGAPKQEILMHKWKKQGVVQVMLGIGASLDFISGKVKRSPKWMSNMGFEWLYRLSQDPKRLAKRYLIQDIAIVRIFIKMMKTPPKKRIVFSD
ncbi:MAG: WecB/TagA/CpsF family glycosyltransferase [Spirochaetaceae bacterium]|nr:WecB/TagA/CpsF family glycosyltransferase [Spirochaetaceae bacterium]